MTELSDKMDKIAGGGYRTEELARHMIKGQQRIHDYEPILADINDEMKHLTLDVLTELYTYVKHLRKREQLFTRLSADILSEASDGKVAKPVPPEAETPANSTGIGGDCPRCGVEDTRLYPYTTKLNFCEKCLKELP